MAMKIRFRFAPTAIAALVILVSGIAACAAQLWPSVKTIDTIPGTQNDLDFLTAHYDWIDSPPKPLDNWYAKNPNLITDKYYHWSILENAAGTSWDYFSLTARWYDWCVKNNTDWESGFFHVSKQDTIAARNDGTISMSNVPISNTLDSRMTYQANTAKLNGTAISPSPVSNNILSVNIATLAPGQTVTITFQAKVN